MDLIWTADYLLMFIRMMESASWLIIYLLYIILLHHYCYWCQDHITLIDRLHLASKISIFTVSVEWSNWLAGLRTPRVLIWILHDGVKKTSKVIVLVNKGFVIVRSLRQHLEPWWFAGKSSTLWLDVKRWRRPGSRWGDPSFVRSSIEKMASRSPVQEVVSIAFVPRYPST